MNSPFTTPPIVVTRLGLIGTSIATVVVVMSLFLGENWASAALPFVGNGLILIAWIISATGFGMFGLRVIRIECELILRIVIATALGLGIESLLVLILGCTGALNQWSAIALLIVGCVGLLLHARDVKNMSLDGLKRPAQWHWLWLGLMPVLGIVLTCAMLPPGMMWGDEPNGYDVTEYHLQVPREWFEAGRITGLHHNVFSYMPFNVEMHYLLAMELRGGPWNGMYLAQLMHVMFFVLTVMAIYALLAKKHPRGAIVASVIAGATPWMGLLAPVAYDEGGLLLFGTLAIGLAIRSFDVGCASAHQEPGDGVLKHTLHSAAMKWMLLAGAMAAFACGSKLTAGPMILIPLPILVMLARLAFPPLPPGEGRGEGVLANRRVSKSERPLTPALSRRERGEEALLLLGAFWISALLTLCPWLIRNTIWTHNPVFPEATSIFGKAHWTDTQVERWQRANHLPRIDQQNLAGRLHAGWDQVLGDSRFAYALLPVGVIAFLFCRDRQSICLIVLLLVHAIFWLFFTHLQSRFFVLSIPICALLIGRVEIRGWEFVTTIVALLAAIFGTFFLTWKISSIEHRLAQYQLHLFSLAGLPSLQGLSRLPESDDGRAVELVGEGQAFFYDIPMKRLYYRTVFDIDAFAGQSAQDAWRKDWPTGSDVLVIVNDGELQRFHQTYFAIPEENR